jgi:hypothetical protein
MLDLLVDLAGDMLGDFVMELLFAGVSSPIKRQRTQGGFGLI